MKGGPVREVAKGCVLILFALVPGYLAADGLITGQTWVFSKRSSSLYSGAAGIVSAIGYCFLVVALILAAMHFFSADAKRRKAFSRWGVYAMVMGPVVLLLGVATRIVSGP
jgi:uncharacterized membrane protein YphA (DoxX/SURF4 family)